jgi:D-alanine-D-alanine ligase
MSAMGTDVVILFGGRSSERLVSVASGQNVSRVLPEATPWFLSERGEVYPVTREALAQHRADFSSAFIPEAPARWGSLDAALDGAPKDTVFFLALHGGEGEDGTVQRSLEARGLAFTGSGSTASAAAFDKARAKELAKTRGVQGAEARPFPVATAEVLASGLAALFEVHPRWVLKPRADGSSHGLIHLTSPSQVKEAAQTMAALKLAYLAEVFVTGRELTVGVVDEVGGTVALPVSEVLLEQGAAFDFAGKYLGRATEVTPAVLTDAERTQVQAAAVATHQAVGCFGYSRTDVILTAEGAVVLLEINTLPGMTKASFIPQQLAAAGRDVGDFLRHQLALARQRREASRR